MQMKKSEKQSAIATTIICGLILLILLFCGMTAHRNEMDEGIMVSFGYDEQGYSEPVATAPKPSTTPPTPTVPQAVVEEELMTQEDPSVAMEAEKKKREAQEAVDAQRRKEAEEAAEQQRQREEAERQAALKAEQKAKADRASSIAGGAFANTGSGSGDTSGDGIKGNPAGQGSQGGNSWSLSGRDIKGSIAQPSYDGGQEGKIVVQIRVDASGVVISATIANGTTITDESLRNESLAAAKRNRFSTGGGVAIGTITYTFVMN